MLPRCVRGKKTAAEMCKDLASGRQDPGSALPDSAWKGMKNQAEIAEIRETVV